MNVTQFSLATIFVVTLVVAVFFAIAQHDVLFVTLSFPFTVGPIAAFQATRTKYSLVVGALCSSLCSLISIGPLILTMWFLVVPIGWIDEGLPKRSLFASASVSYFFAVSLLGGYAGGLASKPD